MDFIEWTLTNITTVENSTNNSQFLHFNEELKIIRPIITILQGSIGLTTVLASLVALFFLFYTKRKCVGSSRRFFIALTIADLQCGIICTISFHFVVQGMKINNPYCMKAISAVYYSLYVTFFMLVSMTIDRYFAIIHALTYQQWSTKTTFWLAVVFSWCGGAFMGFCVYYTCLESSPNPDVLCLVTVERTNDIFTVTIIFLVNVPCTLLILYSYVRIFKVILKTMFPQGHACQGLKSMIFNRNIENFLIGINKREVTATLILFLSILLFILIWLPWCIVYVYFKYYPEKVSLLILLIVYLTFQLNSMIHPFLYVRSVTDKRKIMSKWMICIFCPTTKTNPSESIMINQLETFNKPT